MDTPEHSNTFIISVWIIVLILINIIATVYYHSYKHLVRSTYAKDLFEKLMNNYNNKGKSTDKIAIIIFDGVCNVCNSTMKFVHKLNTKNNLYMAWNGNKQITKPLLMELNISDETIKNSIVLVEYNFKDNNLRLYFKSSAILQITTYLRSPFHLLICLIVVPKFLRDIAYSTFAKYRYILFGISKQCNRKEAKSMMKRFVHAI
eukprot:479669_1